MRSKNVSCDLPSSFMCDEKHLSLLFTDSSSLAFSQRYHIALYDSDLILKLFTRDNWSKISVIS